jgi:hypothetical protein
MTTLHDIEGVLGRPLDAFLWALTTISWSQLLARVQSGPEQCGHESPTLGAHTHAHAHPCPWV